MIWGSLVLQQSLKRMLIQVEIQVVLEVVSRGRGMVLKGAVVNDVVVETIHTHNPWIKQTPKLKA